ncbi:MAG TPA: hypothetical protein PLE88_11705 [Anaerohalosphaeraceae bacterium]|nr:hypothetical protein [Anaerohalosphaeraceae bacterium]
MMENAKEWYKSKTVWGAILALAVAVLTLVFAVSEQAAQNDAMQRLMAVLQDPQTQDAVQKIGDAMSADNSTQKIIGVLGVVGSLIAIYGRITAKDVLK